MKLNDILKRNFILPLVVSFLISICIAVALSNVFVKSYFNQNLQQKLREAEKRKIAPLMDTVEELIYRKIQAVFTDLTIIKKYFAETQLGNTSPNCDKLQQYLLNTFTFQSNYSKEIEEINKRTDIHYYDKANWFISPTIIDCESIKDDTTDTTDTTDTISTLRKKLLSAFYSITPIIRVLYELHKEKEEHKIETFFIANRKTELLFSYPMHPDRESFYHQFADYPEQKEFCRNKNNKIPYYFYFPCRDWFI